MTKSTKNPPATREPATIEVLPTPPRINLSSIEHVRRELARVYRDARTGKIETQDATRFAYILDRLLKVFELTEIERRIAALEDNQP